MSNLNKGPSEILGTLVKTQSNGCTVQVMVLKLQGDGTCLSSPTWGRNQQSNHWMAFEIVRGALRNPRTPPMSQGWAGGGRELAHARIAHARIAHAGLPDQENPLRGRPMFGISGAAVAQTRSRLYSLRNQSLCLQRGFVQPLGSNSRLWIRATCSSSEAVVLGPLLSADSWVLPVLAKLTAPHPWFSARSEHRRRYRYRRRRQTCSSLPLQAQKSRMRRTCSCTRPRLWRRERTLQRMKPALVDCRANRSTSVHAFPLSLVHL